MSVAEALVIDASAAIAVVLGEDQSDAVDRAIRHRSSRGVRLLVPELFWIEVGNTLVRRYQQPFDVVLEAIATLDRLGLITVQTDRAGVLAAVAASVEHVLSAYDATYLALAETLDAELLTLDKRLAAAAHPRAVDLDAGGLRESPGVYRLEPWITWSRAAEYFEAVRRTTLDEARS